jgi:hypothetical protein
VSPEGHQRSTIIPIAEGLTKMRAAAAVFEKLCTPLSVTEVEVDEPGAGEALVKVVATGVCHTDALARDGDMPFPAPGVLGHEGAGIVEAVGTGVTNVAVGDKVVIGWPWCGQCRNCLEGHPRYCLQLGRQSAGPRRPCALWWTSRPKRTSATPARMTGHSIDRSASTRLRGQWRESAS